MTYFESVNFLTGLVLSTQYSLKESYVCIYGKSDSSTSNDDW